MHETIVCPIKEAAWMQKNEMFRKLSETYCMGRGCAWYDTANDQCSVLTIAINTKLYGIDVVQNKQVGGSGSTHFGGKKADNYIPSHEFNPIKGDETAETARRADDVSKQFSENQVIFDRLSTAESVLARMG